MPRLFYFDRCAKLHVDRKVVDALSCFHNGLGNCRMGVYHAAKLIGGRLESHCNARFGKQFGCVGADDMYTENFVVLFL